MPSARIKNFTRPDIQNAAKNRNEHAGTIVADKFPVHPLQGLAGIFDLFRDRLDQRHGHGHEQGRRNPLP